METYAFLPREAVTAFLMGCPQCSTNNSMGSTATESTSVDGAQQLTITSTATVTTTNFCRGVSVEQWSSSAFACSTPVKHDAETGETKDLNETVIIVESVLGADKENVERQTTALMEAKTCKVNNKRKRTVPLKIGVRQPCRMIPVTSTVESDNKNNGGSTLKNSSNSSSSSRSCTLLLSSPSSSSLLSSRTDNSGVSRSSGYWWSKWGQQQRCNNRSVSGTSGNLGSTCTLNNMQPLDLSSSPTPTAVCSSSSSVENYFYKRRYIRRRRVRSKRLNRSHLGRGRSDYHEDDDDISVSGCTGEYDDVIDGVRGNGVNRSMDGGKIVGKRAKVKNKMVGDLETDEEDGCPRPSKIKCSLAGKLVDRRNNNNDDDYYNKVAAVVAARRTTTMTSMVAINCHNDDSDQIVAENMETPRTPMERIQGAFFESYLKEQDVTENNQVSHYEKDNIISHSLLLMTVFDIMDGSCDKFIYDTILIRGNFIYWGHALFATAVVELARAKLYLEKGEKRYTRLRNTP